MKKLLTFLTLLTLFFTTGWADEATFAFGTIYSSVSNSQTIDGSSISPSTGSGVTVTFNTNTGQSDPAYYNSGKAVRVYTNNTIVISAGSNTISNITFTCNSDNYATILKNGTYSSGTASVSGSVVTLSGVNSTSVTVTNTGNQTRINTIVVTYSSGGSQQTTYNVTLNQSTGGTISASATTAAEGETVTLTATPDTGYGFTSWTVLDGEANEVPVTNNQFTMPASDVEVEATFTELTTRAITVIGGTASPASAYAGQTVTVTPTIPDGKVVDQITTVPASLTLTASGTGYTFTMPNEAVTVTFTFKDAPVQSNRFERITSTDDLEIGVRYLLVCEDGPYAMGAISTGSTKYGEKVETEGNFSYNNGVIVLNDNTNVEPLTLNGAPTEWTFKFGNDSYLNWSSGNSLNSTNSVTENSQWVIQFDNDGNAKISNLYSINNQSSSGGVRYIKYNSSSPRFACYNSGQQSIQLYKEVESTPQSSDVYIVGQINGHDSDPWNTSEGVQLTYNSSTDTYGVDIYCTGMKNGNDDGYSYFLFAKSLPFSWDNTSNLYGSGAGDEYGAYWGIGGGNGESAFGEEIPLYDGSKKVYRLPAGLYTVIVDLDYTGHEYTTKSVKVTKRDVTLNVTNSATFAETKNVTMTSNLTELGGKIWYTTDGSDPRTQSNTNRHEYTEQISLDATTTIKAVAVLGCIYSDVVEKTYTKKPAAPVITPASCTFNEPLSVTITAESVATIYYTTDGSDPTNESTQYNGPFTVSATTTVKAIAYVGEAYSSVTTATYTYSNVQPSTGDFVLVTSASQLVAGNEYIIMTTDKDGYELAMGDINSNNKGTWTQEFDITGNVGEAGSKVSVYSESTTSNSLVNILELEGTNGSWALKQQSAGKYLNISGDNTNINESDSKVNVSFTIYNNNSAKIQGHSDRQILFSDQNNVFGNYATSNAGKSGFEYVYLYTRESNSVQPPVFTPAAGIYNVDVDVTISCATTGASIYYTTDGTEPSATNGTPYNGEEFLVSATTTIKAIAVKGDNSSSVVTAEYTINKSTEIQTVTLDYSEPFTAGIGKFTIDNVSGYSPVWSLDGNYGVKGTAYNANTNPTNNAAVSRLVSPIIDMTDATQPELTFSHQINSFFTNVTNQCQLFIRETTDGTDGTWVQLPITFSDPVAAGGWTNDIVDIDLSTYAGKKVQISFLYTNPTAGSGAGTWEIQNFVVADNSEYKMVNNIAEFLALENGTKAKFRNPVTVLYDYAQNSSNSYHEYIWVKDESGYMQFYLIPTLNSGTSLDDKAAYYENGDIIPAGFVVVKNYYENGKYIQAYSTEALEAGFLPATEKGLADPDHIDFSMLDELDNTNDAHVATWCNRYITLEKVKITTKSGKNFRFADENGTVNECVGYNKYNGDGSLLKNGTTSADVTVPNVSEDTYYDVKAILQLWQGGWEIMPIEFTESKADEVTLRKLCADGVEQNTYTISNPLQVVYVDTKSKSVWVKDDNGQSIWSTSPAADDKNFAIDYPDNTRSQQAYYDQSNWCQLVFDDEIPNALVNLPIIKGGMITGKFTNKMNPTLENVELGNEPIMQASSRYNTNYYMAANFLGSQKDYFFMNPKPQEYADIVWAIYNSADKTMTMPSNASQNPDGFTGSFKVDMSMNLDPTLVLQDGTQTGKGYEHFHAIIRLTSATSNAPMLKDRMPANTEYVVYPLDITQDVPTAINTIDVNGKAVKSVKYVNVAGVVSDKPFSGVNIVVTEYTDGSRSTTKMLRK